MTERLYYNDTTLLEFEAHIVECRAHQRGPIVCLDRSAFYPTSGGQPHDVGFLDGIPVLDVWVDDAEEVWHLLAAQPEMGDADRVVVGKVDGARRFDHTQQHTGQHILSAIFVKMLKANTIGFHLGQTSSTIDLDISSLSWATAFEIEAQVNQVIWANLPVNARFVTDTELAQLPLRKPPAVTEHIRVVSIGDFEHSACGGTHVRYTGEIGIVKIVGIERYKGDTRVTFLCGNRALRDYQQGLRWLQRASASLSVGVEELPIAVERLQEDAKTARKALQKVKVDLLQVEAEQLWQATPEMDGMRQIVRHESRDFSEIQVLARALREKPRTVALLAASDEENTRLICTRSDDLPAINAGNVLRAAVGALDGRGGGSPTLAQGGAPLCPSDTILAALHSALAAL